MIERKSIKGNTGKGRFRRQISKILSAVAICVTIIILYELSGKGSTNREEKRRTNSLRNNQRKQIFEATDLNYGSLTEQEKFDLVLSGVLQLVDVNVKSEFQDLDNTESYSGTVIGSFCPVNWSLHKTDPSSYPMFRDLLEHSNCNDRLILDLKEIVDLARKYDDVSDDTKSIPLDGLVFHESRCGSTLVANSLAAMDPDVIRVYSESGPPISAVKPCGFDGKECAKGRSAELLRDVIYMMGRTNNMDEKHLFFKIQSIGTKYIEVFLEAFPDTPWLFVYRDPIQIMVSQLEHGTMRANCVNQLSHVPKDKITELEEMGKKLRSLSGEEKCALHLSLLCESVINAFKYSSHGRAVDYENLSNKLINHIVPDHFQLTMTTDRHENMLKIGGTYSKGRGDKKSSWKEDSSKKDRVASSEIREASKLLLQKSYDDLRQLTYSQHYYYHD